MNAPPRPANPLLQVLLPILVLGGALFFGAVALLFGLAGLVVYLLVSGVRALLGKGPPARASFFGDPDAFRRWHQEQVRRRQGGAAPPPPPQADATQAGQKEIVAELEEFHGSLDEDMRRRKGGDA